MTPSNIPEDNVTKDLRDDIYTIIIASRHTLGNCGKADHIAETMTDRILALLASRPADSGKMVCVHCRGELRVVEVVPWDGEVYIEQRDPEYFYKCNCPDSAFREREGK